MATAEDTLRVLRNALNEGMFPAGSRLPPERDLAAKLRVGRGTLRKAFDALEREGLIRRRVGHGTFVSAPTPGYDAALRLDVAPTPADIMEARLMVEPAIAGAAALRATQDEIVGLERLAEASPEGDWREWERRDNAFHTAVAAASRNPLLVGLLETLHQMRRREDWSRLRRLTLTPERQRGYIAQHRRLVAAITRRDAAAAAAAMRQHLETVHGAMVEPTADPVESRQMEPTP
jgi:DNA-binding FadR family transcriptional regulator